MICKDCISDGAVSTAKNYLDELKSEYTRASMAYRMAQRYYPSEMHIYFYVKQQGALKKWQGALEMAQKIFGGKI